MKPFPLQWEGKVEGQETPFEADRRKLIAYYAPLGFAPAPKDAGDYYYRLLDGHTFKFGDVKWRKIKKVNLPSAGESFDLTF